MGSWSIHVSPDESFYWCDVFTWLNVTCGMLEWVIFRCEGGTARSAGVLSCRSTLSDTDLAFKVIKTIELPYNYGLSPCLTHVSFYSDYQLQISIYCMLLNTCLVLYLWRLSLVLLQTKKYFLNFPFNLDRFINPSVRKILAIENKYHLTCCVAQEN